MTLKPESTASQKSGSVNSNETANNDDSSLSTGAKAGIAVAAVAVLALLAAAVAFCVRRNMHRSRRHHAGFDEKSAPPVPSKSSPAYFAVASGESDEDMGDSSAPWSAAQMVKRKPVPPPVELGGTERVKRAELEVREVVRHELP